VTNSMLEYASAICLTATDLETLVTDTLSAAAIEFLALVEPQKV
jgi:hypothetical protein